MAAVDEKYDTRMSTFEEELIQEEERISYLEDENIQKEGRISVLERKNSKLTTEVQGQIFI